MSDFDDLQATADAWLQPLSDADAPCGPDLEYDNDFLSLTQAIAGKPESQFGPAEPPEWRTASEIAEGLLERTRDLRIAIDWVRCQLHLRGYGALSVGLRMVNGLMDAHWDTIHPMPDPDDGDPYARVNALTMFREQAGLLGDLRESLVVNDRSIGQLQVRDVEAALGLAPVMPGREEFSKAQISNMLEAALERDPALRERCTVTVQDVRDLMSRIDDRLSNNDPPDLRPLFTVVNGIAGLMPALPGEEGESATGEEGAEDDGSGASRGRGFSGSVSSRDEAMRAIDQVIEFLERTEPTNPAPLFLRRARQLVGQNFLQLMKALAPEALAGVAKTVGVDPDSVEDPNQGY